MVGISGFLSELRGFSGVRRAFEPNHDRVRFLQYGSHLVLLFGLFFYFDLELLAFGFGLSLVFHGLGSGCGAHRYWSHRSFETSAFFEWIMGILFTLTTMGSIVGYVLIHRTHHRFSDGEKDPHSPEAGSSLNAWLGKFDKENLRLQPKAYFQLMQDSKLRTLHKYYFAFILGYLLLLTLVNPLFVVYFYCLPVVIQFHINSCLIVAAHSKRIGYRNYPTGDNSKNLPFFFKLFCLGEEMHNNHHKSPGSPTMNLQRKWSELDPLEYVIQYVLSKKSGLAKWV